MSIIETVQKFLAAPDALGRLNDLVSTRTAELEKLDKEIVELDRERKRLWLKQDVEGLDVADALVLNDKKQTALKEKRQRLENAIGEIEQRRGLAQNEINRQAHLAAIEEMKELNTDTEQLTAEFRAATAAFLEAAARSTRSNQRKVELLQIMSNYAGATDETIVTPDWCEQLQRVDWSLPENFNMDCGRDVLLSLRMEWQESAKRHGGAYGAYLLEKASAHFDA